MCMLNIVVSIQFLEFQKKPVGTSLFITSMKQYGLVTINAGSLPKFNFRLYHLLAIQIVPPTGHIF